jgi:ORF19
MMDRQEAVQRLSKGGRLSIAHAEDLYDSIVPKPVIPYYIADYLEKVKSEGDLTVVGAVNEAPEGRVGDWLILEKVNIFAQAWVNGYKVEGEPRYTVRFVGITADNRYLSCGSSRGSWFLWSNEESQAIHTRHTRKELETNGFGWVFDCPGVEVKEVTNE